MSTPILAILFTVFQSIFQVFLICLAGYALCYNGIVDKPTSKVLNHINIALFTPALLFSKVAFFLTPAKLRQLWVIPIFFTVLTGLSGVIAHYLARACRLKRSQINFATAASMFMNSNSLPVALMQSLAATVPMLKWGPDDTIDAMFGRSLTYLVVFSTLGMILRWSYGVQLLTQADDIDESHAPPTIYTDTDATHPEPPLSHIAVVTPTARLIDYENETDTDDGRPAPIPAHPHPHPHPHPPFRARSLRRRLSAAAARRPSHSLLPAVPTSLGDESESESESDQSVSQSDDAGAQTTTEEDSEGTLAVPSSSQTSLPAPAPPPVRGPLILTPSPLQPKPKPQPQLQPLSPRQPTRKSLIKRLLAPLTSLSPPLTASLAALLIALVPPLQETLKLDVFIPLKGALDAAGGCSVPLTLIVLGGWFWEGGKGVGPQGVVNNVGVNSNGDEEGNEGGSGSGTEVGEGKGKGVEKGRSPRVDRTAVSLGLHHADANAGVEVEVRDAHTHTHLHLHPHPHSHPHARTHLLAPTSPSRTPSSASLSSIISAFGDVLMARISPGSASGRVKKVRGRSSLASLGFGRGVGVSDSERSRERDAEAGEGLTTHVETEDENEIGSERVQGRMRSRSRSGSRTSGTHSRPSKPISNSNSNSNSKSQPYSNANKTVNLTHMNAGKSKSKNPPGETLTIVVTLLARMIIVPLVVTPAFVLVRRTGWGGEVFDDPVFLVSSMLLIFSPPALTLAQISQRAQRSPSGVGGGGGGGADSNAFSPFERLLSRTVCWAYCVLTPPLTILSVMIGLMLVGDT